MILYGKFIINDVDYLLFVFDGIGVFMVFFGNGVYRNKGVCGIILNVGLLLKGKYYIVDRFKGSMVNRFRVWGVDIYKSIFSYYVDYLEWFVLFCDDGNIDDFIFYESVVRGGFRLYLG